MRKSNRLAVITAAAFVVAISFSSSAFADWRNRDETSRGDRGIDENRDRSLRDDERVTVEGRISNITRERDRYRVQLENQNYAFWVPERSMRDRNLRLGIAIRLGGIFRNGAVFVDVIDDARGDYGRYDDRYGYNRGHVRGVVQDINYRRGLVYVRDEYSRRLLAVDMDRVGRRSLTIGDLRRGDYIDIAGEWSRRGIFEAYRVDDGRGYRRW